MTPKVKVKVKKEVMAKGEMTGKLYPKKELDMMEKKFRAGMQAQWKSRPENQSKTEAMSKRKKVLEDMPKKKK